MTSEHVPGRAALIGHTSEAETFLNIVVERGVGVEKPNIIAIQSVEEAVETISSWPNEERGLIVSEMFYPGGGGAYELLVALHDLPDAHDIRVIVLTNHEGQIAASQIQKSFPGVPIINRFNGDVELLLGVIAGKEEK